MPRKKNDYEHMYLSPLEPEGPLSKGTILQALVRTSGDTVGAVDITLDGFTLWRNRKLVKTFPTIRVMFAHISKRGW